LRERLFVAAEGRRPRIEDYSGRGALSSWLRVVALRAASNLHRGGAGRPHLELDEEEPPAHLLAADPELLVIRARCGEAFPKALRDAFAALTAEERSLLRFHFLDGLGIDQLAPILGVHRATAARRLSAARGRMVEETLRLLGDRLGASPAELES